MSAPEKAEVVAKVSSSPIPKRKVLRELGIPKSTYYRWLRRQDQQGLEDRPGGDQPPWNRLTIQEERSVLLSAREMPELSCRQLAAWITDNQGFSVSESSVYRILGREGLVKRPEMRLAAGKEYHRKTTGPHQMWATDASYFRVVGWGYYYLVTVMDDYSRFILAHRLQQDMTADSFIEVVQDAVDTTSMDQVPVTDRTRLLSDNGPGYVSRAFRDYLGMVGIKHILATPFHPQTNGKLEREVGWEKWTPKSDKLERRRCQDEEGPARKVYQGIPAGSSEAGIGRESVIARGRASVVLTAIDVGVLGEAI